MGFSPVRSRPSGFYSCPRSVFKSDVPKNKQVGEVRRNPSTVKFPAKITNFGLAGRQRLGCHRQPEGRAHDGAGGAVVHADAAGHRHAQADGRRARLPGHADRLRRHRRPRQRSRGLGQVRPSRVGAVQARQDQPELLHQRAELHRGRVLRGDRQDERAHRRGPQPPGRGRLREERGERRRPLRRHHRDVPQQLVPGRRPRHRAHVHVGGRRRGEVHPRLQLRQPRRRAVAG